MNQFLVVTLNLSQNDFIVIVVKVELFFFVIFFGVNLCHFTINENFRYVTNMQAYLWKTEIYFDSEEKKVI